ncbi:ABC transporter permease [Paludibacterium yongneupense]|uniref:ABC transporter permease n=1 Tax=Paludibacterium yongneupense TaxID=400061 RepID=UPI00040FC375|nr:ABC transporter permease [Paludibacterium yongneupense]
MTAASLLARGLRRLGTHALTWGLTLSGLLLFTFLLSRLSPIDSALQWVGDHASASSYAQARLALGLDRPLPLQFAHYLGQLLHGDLGMSRSTSQPVLDDLKRVFPATLELATVAIVVGSAFGLSLALLSARYPGGAIDTLARVFALFAYSLPVFWLGLLALLLFYARLHWAGGPGRLDDVYLYTLPQGSGFLLYDAWRSGDRTLLANVLSHLCLPALVLALHACANIARLMRAGLLAEMRKDYILASRARGAGPWRVLLAHALPNAGALLLTVLALSYAGLLEGAVLTETVFAWPGVGRYLTTALFAADTAAILGATLLIGLCFILLNALADVLIHFFDPRSV